MSKLSSIIPPTPPPSALLRTLLLLHLPPPPPPRFLQSLNPLLLLVGGLTRYRLPACCYDQLVQFAKTGIGVIGLFARVVGLDHEIRGFGCVVAGSQDGWMQERREQGEKGGGWEAEGGF